MPISPRINKKNFARETQLNSYITVSSLYIENNDQINNLQQYIFSP